jgi:long-chain acyl-CoA synthetase
MGCVVLLTGASGFLGTEIARRLLQRPDTEVVALVLAAEGEDAGSTLARAWSYSPDLEEALSNARVEVVAGDVRRPGLGVDADVFDELVCRVTHIVHAAADLRLQEAPDELRPTNVDGVANVLAFARSCDSDHGLIRMSHVSTAYVAGARTGEIGEERLDDTSGFANAYELTKFEGERLVRTEIGRLPVSIFRPAMVVGDSRTGEVRTFNTFYLALRRYMTSHLRLVPASGRLRVNIVPVDYVADAIVRLTFDPAAEASTFHLTAPTEDLPTARQLMGFARGWARRELDVRLPRPVFVPMLRPSTGKSALELERGRPSRASTLDAIRPYLQEDRQFRRDNTELLLGPYALRWRAFMPALLDDAVRRGFMHRSDRTVNEQVAFRLAARSIPVRCLDILGGSVQARTGADVREDILAAAAGLRGRGVGRGTRVGIVGPNGTRYLTIDIAVGLVGGVTVPMYSTSPSTELDHIIRASGAQLLFVGSADVMRRLGSVASAIPCISFVRGPDANAGAVETWEEFLEVGRAAPAVVRSPVEFDDIATLRYTSGTTGPPKGVAFTHRQLRWMAETMAGLVSWRTRTRPIRYLSFLPMNHVVEGILGTYAPYYLPAPVEIAFLDDFSRLAEALRIVRPNVFFAVPRFYEKVLRSARASKAVRRFLSMPDGRRKRLLRPLIRRRLLRRAGLDRCSQLMVGSAAVDETLVRAFRELGVQIHNAYGLTEAPLVTLNRSGRNRIGTAGEPLPETRVQIADDGEVLVRGPQVTVGYTDETSQPFEAGWLRTGDLGHLTPEGALVIDGRKKDLLKTSYGKYLNPSKIESMLREISGVTDAMVVGEARPFCAALLWIDGAVTPERVAAIRASIARANLALSHPEQVKRWVVLENDLSVSNGDLTPNLKIKRTKVAERLHSTIEKLYAGDEASLREVVHA